LTRQILNSRLRRRLAQNRERIFAEFMKNSKVVNLVFLGAGALVWFLTMHYLGVWMGYFQVSRRLGPEAADLIRHVLPIVLGVLTFIIFRKNIKANHFVSDSVDELFRVVFPESKAIKIGTVWVITIVILAGLSFAALDWGITSVLKSVIGVGS
jgi:preprotein translocase SecE subunit